MFGSLVCHCCGLVAVVGASLVVVRVVHVIIVLALVLGHMVVLS